MHEQWCDIQGLIKHLISSSFHSPFFTAYTMSLFYCIHFYTLSIATPDLDFLPTLQVLTFTTGQSINDTACASVTIVEDVLVEAVETFEVTLLPTAADLFKVLIISGQDKGIVAISDGETDNCT